MAGAHKKRLRRTTPVIGPSDRWGEIDQEEIESLVCQSFCEGMQVREIVDKLLKEKHLQLTREMPYAVFRRAALRQRLRYVPPLHLSLSHQMQEAYEWLARCRVVHTAVAEQVANEAAELLFDLIRSLTRQSGKEVVHLAFGGGGLLRDTARFLADLLRRPPDKDLPRQIVLHALVASFDTEDPLTDPNAFFGYFTADPPLEVRTQVIGLHAPGIVSPESARVLREIEGIKGAFDQAEAIDIVVTSAGHWDGGCSRLYKLYQEKSGGSVEELRALGCMGDVMWRPVAPSGPISADVAVRAFTLLELDDLPGFVEKRKPVVLVLGPCGSCGGPKTAILRAVLGWERHYFSHVVVDSRAARQAMAGRV